MSVQSENSSMSTYMSAKQPSVIFDNINNSSIVQWFLSYTIAWIKRKS